MSLSIDNRRISGIYALGQWFKVKPGTFWIDAYDFVCLEEHCPFGNEQDNRDRFDDGSYPRQPHSTCYSMGALYPERERSDFPQPGGNQSRMTFSNPSGHHGVQFIDDETEEVVSFSLLEVRAFRELTEDEVVKRVPRLARVKRS